MKATLVSRQPITDSIISFSFKPAADFVYTAGQFINLTLTGHQEDGPAAQRWFTISSSPHEQVVTITTRVGMAAHSPYKRALNGLKIGSSVDISERWATLCCHV